MKSLPTGATALDFAFDIHTKIGEQCIGAKVNHKLVPLSRQLKSGDQVEILTSSKQTPKEDWINFVVTARAKSKIKSALKDMRKKIAEDGREKLERKFKHLEIDFTTQNIQGVVEYFQLPSSQDLFYRVGTETLNLKLLKHYSQEKGKVKIKAAKKDESKSLEQVVSEVRGSSNLLIIGDNLKKIDYKLSPCCSPIPGDDVFGFITINEGIKIHRLNCSNALQLMSNFAYRIVKAKWTGQETISFLAGIKVTGIDELGIVNNITKIISSELNVNMRSINFDTNDGIFEGTIMVFVHDTNHLTSLIKNLKKVHGVLTVTRIDTN